MDPTNETAEMAELMEAARVAFEAERAKIEAITTGPAMAHVLRESAAVIDQWMAAEESTGRRFSESFVICWVTIRQEMRNRAEAIDPQGVFPGVQ